MGHVGLKFGPKQHRWIPNWSHVMHMEIQVNCQMLQLGTFGDSFAPSWGQRRHNMGNIASNEGSIIDSKKKPLCSPFWSYMDLNLGLSCSHTGVSWGQVAQSWSRVGPSLGPSAGALLAEVGPKLGLLRPRWIEMVHLFAIDQECRALFGGCSVENEPSSWSCTSRTICPVASTAKLPRLGTFGAGGFPKN